MKGDGRQAEVVPPPVDVDFFLGDEEAVDGGGEYCLVVTALAPYKRVELAIAACERLGIELRLIGTGPERQRLERLAGARTRFLGRVSAEELRRQLRGARLFLQPGVEDFGISSVEALACGTPVVAVGRGGILDIVDNGVHGVLYELPPAGDTETEVGALAAAIDKSRNMRFNKLKLKDRARSFSTQRFTQRILSTLSAHLVEPDRSPGSEAAIPGRTSQETSSR